MLTKIPQIFLYLRLNSKSYANNLHKHINISKYNLKVKTVDPIFLQYQQSLYLSKKDPDFQLQTQQ